MLFPYPVIDPLGPGQVETWKAHFAGRAHERPRCIEEGIWRRTQEPQNAAASGWSPEESGRRRMVHYNYRYRLDTVHPMPRLVLDQFYLYHSLTGPKADIEAFLRRVEGWLTEGGWRRRGAAWARGDLRCRITAADEHPEDVRAGRPNPPGFSSMEAVFTSVGARIPRQVRHLPWDVLAWGCAGASGAAPRSTRPICPAWPITCRSRWSWVAAPRSRPASRRCTTCTRSTG
ncbi:hypothetical protein ACFQXA_15890 [Nocardiopsis composta]